MKRFSLLKHFFDDLNWSLLDDYLVDVSIDNSICIDLNRSIDHDVLGHLFLYRHLHNLFNCNVLDVLVLFILGGVFIIESACCPIWLVVGLELTGIDDGFADVFPDAVYFVEIELALFVVDVYLLSGLVFGGLLLFS